MFVLNIVQTYAREAFAFGVLCWILFLVAIRMITFVITDGGLIPPLHDPHLPPATVDDRPLAEGDCIIVEGIKVCSSDESDGPLWL
jgi:hypothetical protein